MQNHTNTSHQLKHDEKACRLGRQPSREPQEPVGRLLQCAREHTERCSEHKNEKWDNYIGQSGRLTYPPMDRHDRARGVAIKNPTDLAAMPGGHIGINGQAKIPHLNDNTSTDGQQTAHNRTGTAQHDQKHKRTYPAIKPV